MRTFLILILICVSFGCTPSQTESASGDSTSVVERDSSEVFFASEMNDTTDGHMINDEYVFENQYSYISSPFDFNLDSATVAELLGPGVAISSRYTPAGEDQYGGAYEGFSYYDVIAGDTKLSFYSYSGKHHADINTSLLTLKNGVKVGMTKADFLYAMGVDDQLARNAETFVINDDYGSMSFHFTNDTLRNVQVDYEEGD